MSDQAHSREGAVEGNNVEGDVRTLDVCRWISPQNLTETRLPIYSHPKYDAIESSVTDSSKRWARLENLAEQFSPIPLSPDQQVGWSVEVTSTSLRIQQREHTGTPSAGCFVLPNQAIILHLTANSAMAVEYWDNSVYQGGGCARADLLVLTSNSPADAAWIAWELRTN